MKNLYQMERSPIQDVAGHYQSFGAGKLFLAGGLDDCAVVQKCALVDLTNLPRVGFRGIDTAEYLIDHGFELPQTPNTLITQKDTSHIVRLSATEYLLVGGLDDFGEKIIDLEKNWVMDGRLNYLLPRQDSHACLQITGPSIALIMAKLCAVDLSEEAFLRGQVAQTSVARINAIVMNVSDEVAAKFNILCDRTISLYLWEVLEDAIYEFNGQVVGIEALI